LSKRTRISAGNGDVKASRGELEHGLDLLPRNRELFQHLVNGHAIFKVFEDDRHRCACALEYPGSAELAGDTLYGRALINRATPSVDLFPAFSSRDLSRAVVSRSRSASEAIELSQPTGNWVPTGED
jgi:hypothetical protein